MHRQFNLRCRSQEGKRFSYRNYNVVVCARELLNTIYEVVVVLYVGPWVWEPPSPGGSPPSPDYGPEEEEQPTLHGDRGSERRVVDYVND
ncbi:hypothetical protein CYMTET_14763 [Cymbomonas tetramitiformis]|uniref:Uncharacterized protein n=1 Tax=Cymbomonas tetramitiformis TaxID=36881 RepID=A0AAE0L9Q0_9CHLO|nr:hypothetical protein CYMTET_14763 [Cymbomonas tetramitiformis]